jgi:hypothetical protein
MPQIHTTGFGACYDGFYCGTGVLCGRGNLWADCKSHPSHEISFSIRWGNVRLALKDSQSKCMGGSYSVNTSQY